MFSIGASFSNTGNTLALTGPGTFASSGTIQGGTVSVAAGTLLDLSGTVDGVTVNGSFQVDGNNGVVVEDGLTLNGTATLGDSTGFGLLYFEGTQTLGGSGTVVFGTFDTRNALMVASAGTTLTIGAGITVQGQNGYVGYDPNFGGSPDVSVVNQGTIAADTSGGTITVYGTGGEFQNSGTVNASLGTISISTGSYGTVNSGTLAAGPTGTLDITGPYTQTSTGNLNEVLGGSTTGLYGQTSISGTASLNGTLNISEANGFSPNAGDVFTFLTYTSEAGQFANYSGLVLSGSAALEPAYNSTSVTLTTVANTTIAPDLRVTNLSINPANPQSSQSVTVNWDDFNAGNGSTDGSWTDYVVVTNTTTGQTIATADVAYDAATSGAIAPNGSTASLIHFPITKRTGRRGKPARQRDHRLLRLHRRILPWGRRLHQQHHDNHRRLNPRCVSGPPGERPDGCDGQSSIRPAGDGGLERREHRQRTGERLIQRLRHGAQHDNRPDRRLGRHPL